MGKFVDLKGQTFGLLKVVRRVENVKPGRPMWECGCACGNTVVVSSTNLTRKGGTRSCGCLRHQSPPTLIDLTGQTFDKLKVLYRDTAIEDSKTWWVCQCECGNIVSVSSDSLRSKKRKSCGCAQFELKHDLTGMEFGYLRVIGTVKNPRIKSNETRWECLCQNCGRIVEVDSYILRHSDPYGHCKCTRFNKEARPKGDSSQNSI